MYRIFLVLVVVVLAGAPPAGCWDVEAVYVGGFGAGDASIAVSAARVPSISYAAEGSLHLATKVLGGWDSEPVAPCGFLGGWSSLALNSIGQPCIGFIDCSQTGNYLKYAYRTGTSWMVETVDDVGWLPDRVSLAINSLGQPCLAYCRTTGGAVPRVYVCFARRTGANAWVKQDVVEVADVTGPSLLIGSGDAYRIAFCDTGTGQLKSVYRTGVVSPWQTQAIDGGPTAPALGHPSLAHQPNGLPAVAYFARFDSGSLALKYARYNGTSWSIEMATTISSDGPVHCSLGVRESGVPIIAYHDPEAGSLKCVRKTAPGWVVEEVDAAPQTGFSPSLAMDSLGNMHAAYFDNFGFNVMYAWSPTPIPDAKLLADGEPVQVFGVAASSADGELGPRIYVQNPDRTAGIQMYFTTSKPLVDRGMVLDIQGTMATIDGERAIRDPVVREIGSPVVIKPTFLTSRALGGGDLGYPAWTVGQRGITGASGLNNIGLLVKITGAFGYVDSGTFTVDDGGGAPVKCIAPEMVPNPAWRYVTVTGISSCEVVGSELRRLLRVRSASDIVVLL